MNKKTIIFLLFSFFIFILIGCTPKRSGASSEATQTQPQIETAQYDYDKILNGDLSDFAGVWKNGGGMIRELMANGKFYDAERVGGFSRKNDPQPYMAWGGDYYTWGLEIPNEMGYGVVLYPVGVDVYGYTDIVPSDTTQVRIILYAHDWAPSVDSIFYRDATAGPQSQSVSVTNTEQAVLYYATANLRLRSEPDTSRDNRIAGVSEGQSVELLETGITATIDGITAPWFRVKTEDGTIGWLFSGYLRSSVEFEINGTTLVRYNGNGGSVTIPDGITHIGEEAFYEKGLTSVTIPNSVTSISYAAFYGNQLTSVVIPDSVTEIKQAAFSSNQLTSVVISNGLTAIGYGAFGNNKLTSVVIPNSVIEIEGYAFHENQLTSITIPGSVTTIGFAAFQNNQLTSLVIPDSVTSIGTYAFIFNQLTSVVISNSVTSIGENTFSNNRLTSVTIPASVTEIGNEAFAFNQLTSLTISNGVTRIGYGAFHSNQLTGITIPGSVRIIGEQAFAGNPLNGNVTIPDASVVDIGYRAFENEFIYEGL